MRESISDDIRARAVRAAQGLEPFDLLLVGGHVVDVDRGTVFRRDVGIVGPLIAAVTPDLADAATHEVIDVSDRYLSPGFIDMHVHYESSMLTAREYAAAAVARGTTTLLLDPHELANVAGLDGVRYAIESSEGLPARFLFQAPSCVPPAPGLESGGATFRREDIAELLSWPGIHGVAEVMDSDGVLTGDARMTSIVSEGLSSGKIVSGHAAGLNLCQLQAYMTAGIDSDHELFAEGDLELRLDAGMTVELRTAVPAMLPIAVEVIARQPELPTGLVGATDDVFAYTLEDLGGMDDLVRRLISHGMPAVRAYRIATLHGALRLSRPDLGRVAPGALADIAIVSDLEEVTVERTLFGGRVVAADADGAPGQPHPFELLDTIRVEPDFTPADFVLHTAAPDGTHRVRTIDGPVVTSWSSVSATVVDGAVQIPDASLLIAVIDRYQPGSKPVVGLATGWGEQNWEGAIATTVSHDTHNLVVFGRDTAEMALAANTVIASRGGVAVVQGDVVLAQVALPIAGLLSDKPFRAVAAEQRLLARAAHAVGLPDRLFTQPVMQLFASNLACLPGPHVSNFGIVEAGSPEIIRDLVEVS